MIGEPRRAGMTVLVAPGPLDHIGGGAPLRWRSLHSALADHGHVSYYEVPCEQPGKCGGCPERDRLVREAETTPFAVANCPRQHERLLDHVEAVGADRVVVTGLRSHGFVEPLVSGSTARTVIDFHNVESDLRHQFRRAGALDGVDARRLTEEYCERVADIESRTLRLADQSWACSRSDAALLARLHGDDLAPKIHTVPNSVVVPAEPPAYTGPAKVVFTAHLGYLPNTIATSFLVEELAPRLQEALPDAGVVIAGYACPESLRSAVATRPNVAIVDEPADPLAVIAGGISVIPLTIGGGTRFKALEAMSVRAPVVSTGKGVEGLELRDGTHYLRAETAAEFVDAIVRLTADTRLRHRLTANAMRLVRARYSQQALSARVGRCLDALPPARTRAGTPARTPEPALGGPRAPDGS